MGFGDVRLGAERWVPPARPAVPDRSTDTPKLGVAFFGLPESPAAV